MKDESEAPRPKGLGFPVRYFSFIVCPLPLPSRGQGQGALAGHEKGFITLKEQKKSFNHNMKKRLAFVIFFL